MGMPNSDRLDTHQSTNNGSESDKILPKTKIKKIVGNQQNLNAESDMRIIHRVNMSENHVGQLSGLDVK